MICRTTSLYDKNRTTISYDFYRSSDISFNVVSSLNCMHFCRSAQMPLLCLINLMNWTIISVDPKAVRFSFKLQISSVSAATGIFVSGAVTRYGSRSVCITGSVIGSIGFILGSRATSQLQMYLTLGLLSGYFLCMCGMITFNYLLYKLVHCMKL